MRTISLPPEPADAVDPAALSTTGGPDDLEPVLGEVLGLLREMRCAALAGLMRQEVSMGQLHVLWLLEHHGVTSMTRLAEHLGVSLPAATGLIDRMEERGFIERAGDPEDRRRVLVRPGPAGRLALEQTEGLRRERLRRILGRLGDRQLRRVGLAVRDLRESVTAESGTGPGRPAGPGAHHHYFTDDPA
jgi:DNA-binding MarR family transcriptional regulator